ncbi:acetyl-CoA carboxylase biotin carboxyl carrier protein [bacterium]|nr:acetyl-CoA carboxylase biotin carboxyl carrier protein [bacterium]
MELGITDIRALIELVDSSTIGEFTLESGSVRLQLKKAVAPQAAVIAAPAPVAMAPVAAPVMAAVPAAAPAPVAPAAPAAPVEAAPSAARHVVKSPMVGTFYAAPSPDAKPYASIGDRVEAGQVLCIIEAMKLMNEIETEVAGTISKVLVKNGEPVEFGQPLFEIE